MWGKLGHAQLGCELARPPSLLCSPRFSTSNPSEQGFTSDRSRPTHSSVICLAHSGPGTVHMRTLAGVLLVQHLCPLDRNLPRRLLFAHLYLTDPFSQKAKNNAWLST